MDSTARASAYINEVESTTKMIIMGLVALVFIIAVSVMVAKYFKSENERKKFYDQLKQ